MNKDSEELTTRIMNGLRDAEASEGMEQRIVKALRERSASQPVTRWPRVAVLWTWGAAVITVAASLVLSIAMRHRAEQLTAISQGTSSPIAVETRRSTLPRSFELPVHQKRQPKTRRAAGGRYPDPATQPEMLAVSYPAPPMPLTEQERLLLLLAHKGDPVQLAMLDPVQREAKYADERTQIQDFFAPPRQETISEP